MNFLHRGLHIRPVAAHSKWTAIYWSQRIGGIRGNRSEAYSIMLNREGSDCGRCRINIFPTTVCWSGECKERFRYKIGAKAVVLGNWLINTGAAERSEVHPLRGKVFTVTDRKRRLEAVYYAGFVRLGNRRIEMLLTAKEMRRVPKRAS